MGPDDVAERRVLEDALAKVRARATVAPVGQRLDECEKYCERAAKRLEKAKESVGEALKVQTQREEELAEGKRRLEVLRAEAAAQPVPQPTIPGTDELSHLRTHYAQLVGDLRQSHQLATEKISTEISLKERIDLLMQEVAALKVRVPVSGSGGAEMALVPVSRTGSRDRRWKPSISIMRIWCKSVRAKYGYRGVRVGEASNPGPPKWLRRTPSARDSRGGNLFEILSSGDDEPLVPSTVPASSGRNHGPGSDPPTVPAWSGAVRRVLELQAGGRPGRLVFLSSGLPAGDLSS